jgi:hypothetical protein
VIVYATKKVYCSASESPGLRIPAPRLTRAAEAVKEHGKEIVAAFVDAAKRGVEGLRGTLAEYAAACKWLG